MDAWPPAANRLRWLVFAGLLLLHLGLAAPLRGPILFGDETAYLGMARFLVGRAPDLRLASPAMRFGAYLATGYSALLAPLCALAASPFANYRAALAVNAVCAAAAFLLLASFGRRCLGLSPQQAVLAAAAASLYPAFLLSPLLTWTESLLFVLVPGLVLAMQRLAERPTVSAALLAGGTAGFMYWVHQRTLGLLVLTLATLFLLFRRSRLGARPALAAAGAALGLAAVARLVNGAVWAAVSSRGHPLTEAGLLARVLRPEGLREAALASLGQLWYLSAATFGLGLLGAVALARQATARDAGAEGEGPAQRLGAGFAVAAFAVLFLTSAAAFTLVPDRVDKMFYGRYWEPALGLALTAALARLLTGPPRWPSFAATALAAPLLGILLVAARGHAAFDGLLNDLTILGVTPWVVLLGGKVRVLRIAGLTAGCGVALLALARRRPAAAAAVLAALFTAAGLLVETERILPYHRIAEATLRIPVHLGRLPAGLAVAYDEGHFTDRGFYAYPFWIDGRRLLWFDSRSEAPPAPLVISARSWPEAPPGARLVYPESFGDQGLWILPGSEQSRLAAAGFLLPPDPASPLPAAACRSRLERVGDDGPVHLVTGGRTEVRLRVAHRGTAAPWVATSVLPDAGGAVRLGILWQRQGVQVADRRAELPYTLMPGEEVTAATVLEARAADGTPLPPGAYAVRIVLVQELVRWFPDTGDSGLTIPVEVKEKGIVDRLRELVIDSP